MKISMARVRRAEGKLNTGNNIWALFRTNFYSDETEQKHAQERLVADYISKGNQSPSIRVFIAEIPCTQAEKIKEGFISAVAC